MAKSNLKSSNRLQWVAKSNFISNNKKTVNILCYILIITSAPWSISSPHWTVHRGLPPAADSHLTYSGPPPPSSLPPRRQRQSIRAAAGLTEEPGRLRKKSRSSERPFVLFAKGFQSGLLLCPTVFSGAELLLRERPQVWEEQQAVGAHAESRCCDFTSLINTRRLQTSHTYTHRKSMKNSCSVETITLFSWFVKIRKFRHLLIILL